MSTYDVALSGNELKEYLANHFPKPSQIKITKHSDGNKLEGFRSINTSVLKNPFCQKMIARKKLGGEIKSICERCYANTMEKRFNGLKVNIQSNLELFSSRVLELNELPLLNDRVFRLHSLGELKNEIHFKNFLNLAIVNPYTNFTLWSKRKDIVKKVLSTEKLPSNLMLIYSNPKVDSKTDIAIPVHFEKVFSTYSKKGAENTTINCTGKCKECMVCYTSNSVAHVREIVK